MSEAGLLPKTDCKEQNVQEGAGEAACKEKAIKMCLATKMFSAGLVAKIQTILGAVTQLLYEGVIISQSHCR